MMIVHELNWPIDGVAYSLGFMSFVTLELMVGIVGWLLCNILCAWWEWVNTLEDEDDRPVAQEAERDS
jgi:hypothetical protein